MRVISRKVLRSFPVEHADAKSQLESWFHEARAADWKTSGDVKQQYPSASIVGSDRVVFDICGNKYRLVTRMNYQCRIVYIRFLGTHADYDRIDAQEI